MNPRKNARRNRSVDMRNIRSLVLVIIAAVLLCACGSDDKGQVMDGDGMFQTFQYTQITTGRSEEDDGA